MATSLIKKHPILYKKTSTGATQIWYQEISEDGTSFRTVSGQIEGKKTSSGFTLCEPKNVGKANETNAQQQCLLEVQANYKKKLAQGNYKESLDEETLGIDNYFKPMLAKKYGAEEDYVYSPGDDVYSQGKLDGIRCIARREGLFSRQGKPIVSAPHIMEALQPIFKKHPDTILDGELYSDKLSDDFNEIISLARQVKPTEEDFAKSKESLQYWVYDIFQPNQIYVNRHDYLDYLIYSQSCLNSDDSVIKLVDTYKVSSQDHLDQLYANYMEDGFEGQILRLNNKGYENKRSKQLIKRKEFKDEEFEIVDIVEGIGNWAGYAKSVIFRLNDGTKRTSDSGLRGNQSFCKELLDNKQDYIGTLVTITYQNLTPDGKPRFAVATKFHGTKEREL